MKENSMTMTMRRYAVAAALAAAAMTGGCNVASPGSTRLLGEVEYPQALASANDTMSQYFSIESSDPATGIIKARPKAVEAPPDRLLGRSPARQVATMRIWQRGKEILADMTVALERQADPVLRSMPQPDENYEGVPNLPPSQREAATTTVQNESWRIEKYDHATEEKILKDLYLSLHPQSK
jgi:hypothetical protein